MNDFLFGLATNRVVWEVTSGLVVATIVTRTWQGVMPGFPWWALILAWLALWGLAYSLIVVLLSALGVSESVALSSHM